MKTSLFAAIGLCIALQANAAWSQPARVLSCDIPAQLGSIGPATTGQAQPRIFRLSPNRFEEWSAADREFGPNLCETFPCKSDAQRLEGTITTASVAYSIGVDQEGAHWRAKGASNLPRNQGPCKVVPDPSTKAK